MKATSAEGVLAPSGRKETLASFARYLVQNSGKSLVAALAALLMASATEGVSVLLILPVISLFSGGRRVIDLHAPAWISGGVLPAHLSLNMALVLLGFVALVAGRAAALRQKDIYMMAVLFRVLNALRVELLSAIGAADWRYLSNLRRSDLDHALTSDIERIQTATFQSLILVQSLVMISVYAAISIVLSPLMTLFALGSGAAVLLVTGPLRQYAKRYGQLFVSQRREQYNIVSEFLGGLKISKAFNSEEGYVQQLSASLSEMRDRSLAFSRATTVVSFASQVFTAVALAVYVYVAIGYAHLSTAKLVVLIILFMRIAPRVMALQSETQDIFVNMSSFVAMRKLQAECQSAREPASAGAGRQAFRLERAIDLDSVSYAYEAVEGRLALDSLTFTVPANCVTAIIGASGGGKSTLGDLLLGLLSPTGGTIKVDGAPLTRDLQRQWRDQVAYVPQDVFLLNESVEANRRFARPAASEEELWAALAAAKVDAVVRALPDGLRSPLGDRGSRLSGGERQRIALARALLRRPLLLILDEATSALDWESQAAVVQAIVGLKGELTIVTIAHRPSMLTFADRVVALKAGRLVEAGDFSDLAADPNSELSRLLAAEASV